MEGKTCNRCEEWKTIKDFYKNKFTKDGYENQCKQCRIKAMTKLHESQKEKRTIYSKEYWARTKKQQQLYKQGRAEHYRKAKHEYYLANRDYYREKDKKYRQTEQGKEARFKAQLKRRSNKNKVKFTPLERKYILDRDNWTCQNCGIKVHDRSTGNWNTPDKANIDHIISLIHGGNSEPSNLQTLCRTCNIRKKDKIAQQMSLF